MYLTGHMLPSSLSPPPPPPPNFLLSDITEKGSCLAGLTHVMDYAEQTAPILFSSWFLFLLFSPVLRATMLTYNEKNIYLCKCALSLKYSSNFWSQGHQWCVWQRTKQKFYQPRYRRGSLWMTWSRVAWNLPTKGPQNPNPTSPIPSCVNSDTATNSFHS